MLELRLYGASRYGKKRPNYYQFTDERYNQKPEWMGNMYSFVLDQKVRDMSMVKSHIEDLDSFPIFYVDNEEVTQKVLSDFIDKLERCFGKMKYSSLGGERRDSVKKFLEENGVTVKP